MGFKDKKVQYYRGSLKNPIFKGEEFQKNQSTGGCLKGSFDSFQI